MNPSLSDSLFTIQNIKTSLFMESRDDGSASLDTNNNINQIWQLDGSYFTNLRTGLVLESGQYGAVFTIRKNDSDYQKWIITASNEGSKIQNKATERFLTYGRCRSRCYGFSGLFTSPSDNLNYIIWKLIKILFSIS